MSNTNTVSTAEDNTTNNNNIAADDQELSDSEERICTLPKDPQYPLTTVYCPGNIRISMHFYAYRILRLRLISYSQ